MENQMTNSISLYLNQKYTDYQNQFDALEPNIQKKKDFIRNIFMSETKIIEKFEIIPKNISFDRLRYRKDLYFFVIKNWTTHIFLPSIDNALRDNMLMFGLGRIFSSYNLIGAQLSSDFDFNIIVSDIIDKIQIEDLYQKLVEMKEFFFIEFRIVMEINPEFSLLYLSQVIEGLEDIKNKMFYKSIDNSFFLFQDNQEIRNSVFKKVEPLPDSYVFEHLLGLQSAKPTILKINRGDPLAIIPDRGDAVVNTKAVIGSNTFSKYIRQYYPREEVISPFVWVFSMKFSVNRVYDYICIMQNKGYSIKQLGLEEYEFNYLENAHKMMLILQEIKQQQFQRECFNKHCDFSYFSKERFDDFMNYQNTEFFNDFELMMLNKGLVNKPRLKELYYKVKEGIIEKKNHYFWVEPKKQEIIQKHDYTLIEKHQNGSIRVSIPYCWSDLGFFVFSVIAFRIEEIVINKMYPAVTKISLPE